MNKNILIAAVFTAEAAAAIWVTWILVTIISNSEVNDLATVGWVALTLALTQPASGSAPLGGAQCRS